MIWMEWTMSDAMASRDSTAPLGLPGKLRMSVVPRMAAELRDRMAARSFFEAFAAHFFRETGDHFVGDGLGGFGSDIARTKASAASSENQIHFFFVREAFDGGLNL
jgi:hypothetical protein